MKINIPVPEAVLLNNDSVSNNNYNGNDAYQYMIILLHFY